MEKFCGLITTILLTFIITGSNSELLKNIPDHLKECYRNETLRQPETRLPMTMPSMIEIIRKIERSASFNMDVRTFSMALIEIFRLDGIVREPGVSNTDGVIPYKLSDIEFANYKLIRDYFLTYKTQNQFNNETLTSIEKCSLHFMLSSAIDKFERGDEAVICNNLAEFRATSRLRRNAVEEEDAEIITTDEEKNDSSKDELKDIQGKFSACPSVSGVVYTPWGPVSAGLVLAGIAAGLQIQEVDISQLYDRKNQKVTLEGKSDNRYAATVVGNIAEAIITQKRKIGAAGGWNNTARPSWYFLNSDEEVYYTNADIRGGLDGLIMSYKVESWVSQSRYQLSQMLERYYSLKGVSDPTYRACNRNAYANTANDRDLKNEALAFTRLLYAHASIVQFDEDKLIADSNAAVGDFLNAIPSLNVPCNNAEQVVPRIDLYVVIDTMWSYNDIRNILSVISNNIDMDQKGSNMSVYSGHFQVIVNNSQSINEFDSMFRNEIYVQNQQGMDIEKLLKEDLPKYFNTKLDYEKNFNIAGGPTPLVLFIPFNNINFEGEALDRAADYVQWFRDYLPDVKFMYLIQNAASTTALNKLVDDPKDVIQFTRTFQQNAKVNLDALFTRFKSVPRRVSNPVCGRNWKTQSYSTVQFIDFVPSDGINFYRVHNRYLYATGNAKVKVQVNNYGSRVQVCFSRKVTQPGNATTSGEVTCKNVDSGGYEIYLGNGCENSERISGCKPLYFSVQSQTSGVSQSSCTERDCRQPDDLKITISHTGLTCGVCHILVSPYLMVSAIILLVTEKFLRS